MLLTKILDINYLWQPTAATTAATTRHGKFSFIHFFNSTNDYLEADGTHIFDNHPHFNNPLPISMTTGILS